MRASATATRMPVSRTCSSAPRAAASREFLLFPGRCALVSAREFDPRAHQVPAAAPEAAEVSCGGCGWRAVFLFLLLAAHARSPVRREPGKRRLAGGCAARGPVAAV